MKKAEMTGGNFTQNEDGSLRITRADGKFSEMKAFLRSNGNDMDFIWQFYESELTNGYSHVPCPGLTDGLVIAEGTIDDNGDPDAGAKVWWHSDYQIQPFGETIVAHGYIDLPKAN